MATTGGQRKFAGGEFFQYGLGRYHVEHPDAGAKGDGSNDTAAFQQAAADASAWALAHGGAELIIGEPVSAYLITDTVTINQYRVHVRGRGKYASKILFNPTGAKALFKVQNSNTGLEVAQGSFSHFGVIGGGTQQKVVFDLYDTSDYSLESIVISSSVTTSERFGTVSTTNGSAVVVGQGLIFSAADVGKTVMVAQGGAGGIAITTSIIGFTDATHVTLATNMLNTVAAAFMSISPNAGAPSIGLRTAGRELTRVRDFTAFTDRPIHMKRNPNFPSGSADHFHGSDLYLAPQLPTESAILIDADAGIANMTLDGQQAWVGGKSGLVALAGAAPATALNINVSGFRFEQGMSSDGWAVDWQMAVQQLNLLGGGGGGAGVNPCNAFRFRNSRRVTMIGCQQSGGVGTIAMDIDSTCDEVWGINTQFQDLSTVNVGTCQRIIGVGKRNSNAPIPYTFYYANAATANKALEVTGNFVRTYSQHVLAGGNFTMSDFNPGSGMKVAFVRIAGTGGGVTEGGSLIDTPTASVLISGTANFAATNVAGKLSYLHGGNPTILNNTPQALDIIVIVEWMP